MYTLAVSEQNFLSFNELRYVTLIQESSLFNIIGSLTSHSLVYTEYQRNTKVYSLNWLLKSYLLEEKRIPVGEYTRLYQKVRTISIFSHPIKEELAFNFGLRSLINTNEIMSYNMENAGYAIQALKPVFMMGPLSIATYHPQESVKFDLVIFDEASQVKPVDAFGAILRGKQVVVVGDSKQMPPTHFFDSLTKGEESEEDNTVGDMESILGLFLAQNAPRRMLRWHYRSRHESLIAVSNLEFYDNRLVVFPSPDLKKDRSGLVFHYLPHDI